jgi:hypothetical protein
MARRTSDPVVAPATDDGFRVVYDVLVSRRAGYDSLMWQTPSLGLTAQAFLMTIALGPATSEAARLIASSLAFIISVLAMQLMAKHRYHERIDASLIRDLETRYGLDQVMGVAPHAAPRDRARAAEAVGGAARGKGLLRGLRDRFGWSRYSSYTIWMGGLALFALTSIGVVVICLTNVSLLVR